MKVEVLDINFAPQGSADISDALFGIEPREDILARVVRWQLAKRRAGTHQAKTISMVSGTGRKSVRQKGSGGARHGARRATQFRGGGIVFGPTPRDYGYSLQKKVRKLGLRMAVASKIQAGEFLVLNDFTLPSHKTRDFVRASAEHVGSALFVDADFNESFLRAVSNAPQYDVLPSVGLNVYDILRKDRLVLTTRALNLLEERVK